MENLKKFDEFISESLNEKTEKVEDAVYTALNKMDAFSTLGADQQGEIVKTVVKKLNSYGIK